MRHENPAEARTVPLDPLSLPPSTADLPAGKTYLLSDFKTDNRMMRLRAPVSSFSRVRVAQT